MLICKYRKASEEFNEIVYTIEGDIIYCDLTWEDQDIYSAYEEETPEELLSVANAVRLPQVNCESE